MSATEPRESWCDVERVAHAARLCGRRKGGRPDAIAFRLRQREEVLSLSRRLMLGTYYPQPGRVFVTERPKHREVHAAVYRDRVVDPRPVGVPAGVRLRLPKLRAVRGPVRAWRLREYAIEGLRATWASYEGHFVHGSSVRLRERLWNTHPVASRLLGRERGRIVRRFTVSRPVVSLRAQVERLALGIGPRRTSVLLVQVGRFVEVFWNAWRLGLRQRKVRRRWTAGAPWVAAARLVERGLACGLTVAVALEEPEACGNVKRRRLAYLFERPPVAEAEQEESK